jgi:predicted lipoprotein with Yx(FWY)xxD motif
VVVFSLRSSAVAGIVAALSLATAGMAMAAPAVVRDTAPCRSTTARCARSVNDSSTGRVYARSYASCSRWKRDITVETQLRRALSNGTVQT